MKRIISLILLLSLALTLSACGKVEISMQDVADANKTEALLNNHQSVYVLEKEDGEFWGEIYLTEDYVYNFMPSKEGDWIELITDDAYYNYIYDDCVRFVSITPDGVSDFASLRADRSKGAALGGGVEGDVIESISEKDGRIIIKTVLAQEVVETAGADFGVIAATFEFVLDAKTQEVISLVSDYTLNEGKSFHLESEISYDVDPPETLQTLLGYENQTENLRNITIVSNPGTEKEKLESIQVPKGLLVGFNYDDELATAVEFYTDADCTEAYDPFADTDSDLTIYIKWIE